MTDKEIFQLEVEKYKLSPTKYRMNKLINLLFPYVKKNVQIYINKIKLNDPPSAESYSLSRINVVINNYDLSQGIPFYAFLHSCIKKQVLSCKVNEKKKKLNNVSLSYPTKQGEEMTNLSNVLPETTDTIPTLDVLIHKENRNDLITKAKIILSDKEYKIFMYRLEGCLPSEISKRTDLSLKEIDNAFERLKDSFAMWLNPDLSPKWDRIQTYLIAYYFPSYKKSNQGNANLLKLIKCKKLIKLYNLTFDLSKKALINGDLCTSQK